MNNKINIGTASIILIFIILCLSIFSLLSLSDAKSAAVFAERRAASVQSYYRTDREGQAMIRSASRLIRGGAAPTVITESLKTELPEGSLISLSESGSFVCELPMSAGQSLHIELDKTDASVLSYYVYISEEYAIDDRLPVWEGSPD